MNRSEPGSEAAAGGSKWTTFGSQMLVFLRFFLLGLAGLPALASAAASEIVFVVPQNGTILSLKS